MGLGLWRGMRALWRKRRCSFLRGTANPLIIDPKISSISANHQKQQLINSNKYKSHQFHYASQTGR